MTATQTNTYVPPNKMTWNDTEQNWESRGTLHNTSPVCLVLLTAGRSNFPGTHPRQSLQYSELDCTRVWHDTHLKIKQTNHIPLTSCRTNKPVANAWMQLERLIRG